MRSKGPVAVGAVLLLAVVGGFVVVIRNIALRPKPQPKPVQTQQQLQPVDISLPGRIEPKTVVNIPSPTDGIIERFLADVGEDVFEGEVLARIKNSKLDATVEAAQADASHMHAKVADLESSLIAARLEASRSRAEATSAKVAYQVAEKTYLRQKMLMQEGATPRLTYEKAEVEYNKLKSDAASFDQIATAAEDRVTSLTKELDATRTLAQQKTEDLDQAKADVSAGEVHSTVNGIVVARHGQVGEPISSSLEDLFQIATDLTTLEVLVAPDPKLLPRIKTDQDAVILVAEAPGPIPGKVRDIKGGQVVVEFANPLPAVRPGMTAQVKIRLS
jgi:multidrug efflux pump subunit AcrA (membrane-fusion protein)